MCCRFLRLPQFDERIVFHASHFKDLQRRRRPPRNHSPDDESWPYGSRRVRIKSERCGLQLQEADALLHVDSDEGSVLSTKR